MRNLQTKNGNDSPIASWEVDIGKCLGKMCQGTLILSLECASTATMPIASWCKVMCTLSYDGNISTHCIQCMVQNFVIFYLHYGQHGQ